MNNPVNSFKLALAKKRLQIGLWLGLASAYTTEICAGAGGNLLARHSAALAARFKDLAPVPVPIP